MFNVYVDADSFPRELLSIVLKRLIKESGYITSAVFVSDRVIPLVRETVENHTHALREERKDELDKLELRKIKSNISYIVVPSGQDSADDKIVEIALSPALAITHDVPLSSRLCEKGITVIDDRGHIYTKENVKERLSERNWNTELRECGLESLKTKRMTDRDINAFSSAFDSVINQLKRS